MRRILTSNLSAAKAWLLQDQHKLKAMALKADMEALFTTHPKEAGETYLQHWWFTLCLGSRVLLCGVCLLIHGTFPFLLTRAASSQMSKIAQILENRVSALSEHREH